MGEANFYYFTCLKSVKKMGKTKANKTGQDKAYLHPKSRKAKHLSSFQAHNDKSKKAQDLKMARLQSKAAKLMFFKERMEEMFLEDEKLTRTQLLHVIEVYFARFVNEVDQISMIQSFPKRHGRQNAARQDAIAMTINQEKEEFDGVGLEFPDVIHLAGFAALKKWTGSVKEMPNLILKKFKRQDLLRLAEKEEDEDGEGEGKGDMNEEELLSKEDI